MSRVSGATVQQSFPVSSSTAIAEEPVIQVEAKKESTTEAKSHSGAQKQNAIARQSENNLTAMLQRDRIAESPRAYIPKEDVNALATALSSNNGAAEGVKEELAATFKNNGPGQHAKIAECMRQFAAAGSGSYDNAYGSLKEEISQWTKFDRTGMSQPAQRNFFKEVAELRGPGAARVKADVAVMIHNNIEQAKKETTGTGLRAYAAMYTGELGKMLQNDPAAIFNELETDLKAQQKIPAMFDNLLNSKEGHKAIAGIVVEMASANSKSLLRSPDQNADDAYQLGRFMAQFEKGIERNAKNREEAIEKGASILTYGLKAAQLISPKEAKEGFSKVNDGIEYLKKRDIESVEEAKKQLISTMYDLAETSFTSMADHNAANYKHALVVFEKQLMQGRRDALERESIR